MRYTIEEIIELLRNCDTLQQEIARLTQEIARLKEVNADLQTEMNALERLKRREQTLYYQAKRDPKQLLDIPLIQLSEDRMCARFISPIHKILMSSGVQTLREFFDMPDDKLTALAGVGKAKILIIREMQEKIMTHEPGTLFWFY